MKKNEEYRVRRNETTGAQQHRNVLKKEHGPTLSGIESREGTRPLAQRTNRA
jgi:hypothetical protein